MICECGGILKPQKETFEGMLVNCLKCEKCGKITFTQEQMHEVISMKDLSKKTNSKRKVIILGHSLAITLPKRLEKIGLRAGQRVSVRLIGKRTLELKFGEEEESSSKTEKSEVKALSFEAEK